MAFELSRYEKIVSNVSCSYKLHINKYVSKEQIEEAIYILAKEYSYLSSEYREGTRVMEYKVNYHPPVHYFEKPFSDSEYYENIKQATGSIHNNTSEYFIYADKSKNESQIIGIYNHGMVDGISCTDLCHKLCLHLSDPTVIPKLHPYVSAQGRMKIPKEVTYNNYNVDENVETLKLPLFKHECKDPEKMYSHVYTSLIKENEMKEILKYTHEVKCSFQGLLWITTLLSQMKLFDVNDFSKPILFHSMATSRGRAEFDPPLILDEDILCGGMFTYITKKINKEDKITDITVYLTKQLHSELDKKQQMYEFFMIDDYRECPAQTITCCTMGKRPNQKHYDGKFSFDILDQNFLASYLDDPNNINCGMDMFCFTIGGVGCYISNGYIYPHFTDDEMKNYVEDIIKMMKYCSKEENKNITVEELMKI